MAEATTSYSIRDVSVADTTEVLELINLDRVAGQPLVTAEMLSEALAGRSAVDSGWWEELSSLSTEVAVSEQGTICGVISYARRTRDNAGLILWLHAGESRTVVDALLGHALSRHADCTFAEAFSFSSALTVGLEALPVRHRPQTHAALVVRGFTYEDMWRYMHRLLPAPELEVLSYHVEPDGDTRKLVVRDGEANVAEATIGLPVHGIGILWWIGVEPAARGRAFGRQLLGSALDLLTGLGATEVILYVDDDEPGGERDRSAANRLYNQAGFTEVDRLYSYRRDNSSRQPS